MIGVTRRTALLLPFGVAGCSSLSGLLDPIKPTLTGTRIPLSAARRGLEIKPGAGGVATVPPVAPLPDWPQAGGNATHTPGNPAVANLNPAWTADIGAGTGYRQRITAQPVIAGGRVITMDANGTVSAFALDRGRELWRTNTRPKKNRSTNVGGGVAASATTVWATTGRAEVLALDAATGHIRWRKPLGSPARSSPTLADGRLYTTTLEGKLLAFAADTGEPAWNYQASTTVTSLFAVSSPAAADGFVIAGFNSGELVAVRADSGALAWSDSLASAQGTSSLTDLSAISALPVIDQGRVFAIGVDGLLVSLDLRSGRRLWERDVGGSETPWVAGESMWVLTQEQALAALDPRDGRPFWVDSLERFHNVKQQSGSVYWVGPLLAGGKLIAASSDGQIAAFDPARGTLLGSRKGGNSVTISPIAASGTLILLDDEGTLAAYR